jgi:rubredoxin
LPVAEISAGITSVRAAYDLAKAMVASRDAKLIAGKADELRLHLGDAIGKFLEAQQAQMAQLEQMQALKEEVAKFRNWDNEKSKYELKGVGQGVFAYMPKPEARDEQPPHWLCPTCFAKGQKAFFQASGARVQRAMVYRCKGCDSVLATENEPEWL